MFLDNYCSLRASNDLPDLIQRKSPLKKNTQHTRCMKLNKQCCIRFSKLFPNSPQTDLIFEVRVRAKPLLRTVFLEKVYFSHQSASACIILKAF